MTKYLASLLLPPDRYAPRRILVPFAGSGSEMIGAMLAGWDEITGIEAETSYVEIARERLKFWKSFVDFGQTDEDVILNAYQNQSKEYTQLSMIDML